MKAFQTFKKTIATFSISGASNRFILPLNQLAQRVGKMGWPAHLAALTLVFNATPPTTAIPTQIELN